MVEALVVSFVLIRWCDGVIMRDLLLRAIGKKPRLLGNYMRNLIVDWFKYGSLKQEVWLANSSSKMASKQAKNSNEKPPMATAHAYVVMEDGPSTLAYSDYPSRVRGNREKRNQNTCCMCSLASLFVFLMCFFLIPRSPGVYLDQISVNGNQNITGEFRFNNYNYFTVDWDHLNTQLYWLPYGDTPVSNKCYTDDNDCSFFYLGYCALKMGNFEDNSEFSTKSKQDVYRTLTLEHSGKQIACTRSMLLNAGTRQNLLLKGDVHAKGSVRNFGDVSIAKVIYRFGN
jgi:hypothetical protein